MACLALRFTKLHPLCCGKRSLMNILLLQFLIPESTSFVTVSQVICNPPSRENLWIGKFEWIRFTTKPHARKFQQFCSSLKHRWEKSSSLKWIHCILGREIASKRVGRTAHKSIVCGRNFLFLRNKSIQLNLHWVRTENKTNFKTLIGPNTL